MKKMLSILLALALLLPGFALALAETLDLGAFTLELPANATAETAAKVANTVIARIIFDDENGDFSGSNINVVWSEAQVGVQGLAELSLEQDMLDLTAAQYAETLLSATLSAMDSMGIVVNSYELLGAGFDLERNMFFMGYATDATYNLLGGFDMSNVVYQYGIDVEGDGAYIFTLTANTLEAMEELVDCFNTLK